MLYKCPTPSKGSWAPQMHKTYIDQINNSNHKRSFNVIYAVSNVQVYFKKILT